MTFVFQSFTIIVIIIISFILLRGGGAKRQAIRRAGMIFFVLLFAFSILFPQVWTWVANLLGIGRGADLLLYLLVLVFIGFVVTTFRKFRSFENSLTALARKVAINQFEQEYKSSSEPKID